jgi:glycosyltransferase involved in cell wall biosynthesis
MKPKLLTTRELLDHLGWPSAKRLQYWTREGILDPPLIGRPPTSSRGRAAYWPEHIIVFCNRVELYKAQGLSLKEAGQVAREELEHEGWVPTVADTNGRVRLVAVMPYFRPRIGGVETHAYQLAAELAQRGHTISIFTQRLAATSAYEALRSIRVYRFGSASKDRGRRDAYLQMLRKVQHDPADKVVLYMVLSVGKEYRTDLMLEILKVARLRGIPRIVRIPSSGRATELAAAHPDGILELHQANRIIALNPGIREELVDVGCDPGNILALSNGVNLDLFKPAPEPIREDIRGELGCDAMARVFVSPSRWAPKKKIPQLIGLWRDFETGNEDRRLWIVGDARHEVKKGRVSRAITEAMRGKVDNVTLFPGRPHHEMPPFYQAADAYVSLSTQEGQSNALLEAMACGLPVVVPDSPCVAQIITDGVNGFVFNPDDRDSALAALLRCSTTSREQLTAMGAQNRRVIEREYTVDLMADRFSKLLSELLPEGSDACG